MKYDISFWNYQQTGFMDEAAAVAQWKDAGITMPMTFEFDPERHDKKRMLCLLDECEKAGMKAIVCDARTRYHRIAERGEEQFRKDVKAAVADFGAHSAVFGFHVGDEPCKKTWEDAVTAYRIVAETAPHLTPFLNMFPYWDGSFAEVVGPESPDQYADLLIDFVCRSGAKLISFDSYGQCAYMDREQNQDSHLRNFRIFDKVVCETGARLFVSVLSVGHWAYRVPTDDDIRWQIYTSVAHGATGIHWFSFYQGTLDGNYRENPVNLFGERTETFRHLSYYDRVFLKFFAPKLERCKFENVSYYYKSYGGFPLFEGTKDLISIQPVVNAASVAVTRWTRDDGKPAYTFVNMERENPTKIRLCFNGSLSKYNWDIWIVPGQMVYIDEDGVL